METTVSNREYDARITDNIEAERDRLKAVNAELISHVQAVANSCELVADSAPKNVRAGIQAIADELNKAIAKARA